MKNRYNEITESFKDLLKQNLTADNSEVITQLSTKLDELKQEHEKLEEENSQLKDKYVEYIKATNFKETPKDEVLDEPKSLDDIITDSVNKIINERTK